MMIKVAIFTMLIFSQAYADIEFSVMSYNLENLFDTKHDEGKKDWTWLPLTVKRSTPEAMKYCQGLRSRFYRKQCLELDWTEAVLNQKIQNLSKVIKDYNQGNGPDVLVVQEVENLNALTQLRDKGLKKMGYQTVALLEGPDTRGIDIGVIARYPIHSSKYHEVNLSGLASTDRTTGKPKPPRPTRGIIEVTLKVGNELVTVYGNHWPSQGNPDSFRLRAAETLNNAVAALPVDRIVIATGDFNTLPDDNPHGLRLITLNSVNQNAFIDVEKIFRSRYPNRTLEQGTHFYRGHWDSLDRIFVLKRVSQENPNDFIVKKLAPLWGSFEIFAPSYLFHQSTYWDQSTNQDIPVARAPMRFNATTGEGFSDHLPVAIKLTIKE